MASSLERVTLRTKHFVATIDIPNRTWDLVGVFSQEVRTIADNPWEGDVLRPEIQELYDLESAIRCMFEVKVAGVEGDANGIRMHDVAEG